jgi:putative nucleotidyltransferase with HDIG domain
MIPTPAQCLLLMEEYGMLANIREHSLMVARVAGFLGRELVRGGWQLSLPLVVAGALLHDIAKTATLGTDLRHADRGREICERHGFFELAGIVGEHVVLKNGVPEQRCSEKEIVYYADKRVLHHEIVSLERRLAYILGRYGNGDGSLHARIRNNFSQAHGIEELLFRALPFAPGQVAELAADFPLEDLEQGGLAGK